MGKISVIWVRMNTIVRDCAALCAIGYDWLRASQSLLISNDFQMSKPNPFAAV